MFHAEVRAAKVGPDNDIPHISAELIDKYADDLRQLGLLDGVADPLLAWAASGPTGYAGSARGSANGAVHEMGGRRPSRVGVQGTVSLHPAGGSRLG